MRKALAVFWLLGAMLLALAQASLRLDLRPYRVVVQAASPSGEHQVGKETFEESPLGVAPGDILEWRLTAQNLSDSPLRQVALVIPIPKETFYLEGSAKPLAYGGQKILPEFSADGGKTFARPPLKKRIRVQEGGKEVEKEVEVKPEEYTHVRYVIPELKAKDKLEVSIRTKVR